MGRKCMYFEVDGLRLRGRPKKTWSEKKIVRPNKYVRKMLWTVDKKASIR